MAIHNGVFSKKLRKSAGDVTFSTWKGIPVLKQKVTEVRNPKSEAQRTQRSRMKALAQLGSLAIKAIRLGFANLAQKRTEFNAFTSINMDFVVGNPNGPATVNHSLLKFAQGNLDGFTGVQNLLVAGNDVSIDFNAPITGDPDFNDSGVLVCYRANNSLVIGIDDDFAKSDGTALVTMPNLSTGDILHVWLFARNADTGAVSNTYYGGTITV